MDKRVADTHIVNGIPAVVVNRLHQVTERSDGNDDLNTRSLYSLNSSACKNVDN